MLYDELVHPANEVTDYLTNFSGIQPGSLDDVTTTLADVTVVREPPLQGTANVCGQHGLKAREA